MTIEEKVKALILSRYPSMRNFADACGIKYSTMLSVFSRGFEKTGIDNLTKICGVLGITVDGLSRGVIETTTAPAEALTFSMQQSLFLLKMIDSVVFLDGLPITRDEALMIDDQITAAVDIVRRQRERSARRASK